MTPRVGVYLALLSLGAACSDSEPAAGACASDPDCPAGFFCEDALCKCRTDDVCGDGRVCNSFGICQVAPQCVGNQDCEANEICSAGERSGGTCILATSCEFNIHCPLGQFCNPQSKTCTSGCRNAGDCLLGDVCDGGQCVAGQVAGACERCPVERGVADPEYCDYGDRCNAAFQSCEPHPDRDELCQFCNNGAGVTCEQGLACLIDDTGVNPGDGYCATVCDDVGDCPGGFGNCVGLTLVGTPCTNDASCSNGGRCVGRSESTQAFCECVGEADCNGVYDAVRFIDGTVGSLCQQGICVNISRGCNSGLDCACDAGICAITGLPCAGSEDCGLECVQVPSAGDTFGQCRTTTRACVKETGVSCGELAGTNPVCTR